MQDSFDDSYLKEDDFNHIDGMPLPSSQSGNNLLDSSQDGLQLDDFNEEDSTFIDDQGDVRVIDPFMHTSSQRGSVLIRALDL